jgi:hypothetical protein
MFVILCVCPAPPGTKRGRHPHGKNEAGTIIRRSVIFPGRVISETKEGTVTFPGCCTIGHFSMNGSTVSSEGRSSPKAVSGTIRNLITGEK